MNTSIYAYLVAGLLFLGTIFTRSIFYKNREPTWMEIANANRAVTLDLGDFVIEKLIAPSIAIILIWLAWPFFLGYVIKEALFPKTFEDISEDYEFTITIADLRKKFTIAEIEERETILDPLEAVPDKPFGFLYPQWKNFLGQVQNGDEIWSFCCAWKGRWSPLCRRDGYAIVRHGRIDQTFLTANIPLEQTI